MPAIFLEELMFRMIQPVPFFLRRVLLALAMAGMTASASAGDLMEAAEQSGTFKEFIEAAKKTGVDKILRSEGPYTVFAPTDEAIAKFGTERWQEISRDNEQMTRLLKHHVLPGKALITEVKPGPAETLSGATIALKSDNGLVKAGTANVTQSDISADNGVIHAIDEVVSADPSR